MKIYNERQTNEYFKRKLDGPMIGDRYIDMNFFWIFGVALCIACCILGAVASWRHIKRRNKRITPAIEYNQTSSPKSNSNICYNNINTKCTPIKRADIKLDLEEQKISRLQRYECDLSIINISDQSMNNGSYTFPHKNQLSPLLNTKNFKISPIQTLDTQFNTKKDKLNTKDRKQVYLTPSRTARRRLIENINTQW